MNKNESQPSTEFVADKTSPGAKVEKTPVEDELNPEQIVSIDIKGEVGDDLGDFFKAIKKKFNDSEDGWTPAELEANSTEILAPIIRELRGKLIVGGAEKNHADGIMQEMIEIAQSSDSKESFIDKMTNSASITNPEIIKFNIFISNGLEK